jgi:chemotaxis protein CheX
VLVNNRNQEEFPPLLEQSVREVFEIMLECELDRPTEVPSSQSFEFTDMIGLAGELCAVITFPCSAKSARLIASKMLGGDSKYPDEQLWDAVGELCNVIAGNFKNKLTRISERCMRSVPTVITGATTAVTHWRTPVA